jgi:hypothetical protein
MATDLEHDLRTGSETQRARVAGTTTPVDVHRHGPTERREPPLPEWLAPDAEESAERRAALVADDATRVERPHTCATARADDAAEPETRSLEPDRSGDDHDPSPREQLDVNTRTRIERRRTADETRNRRSRRRLVARTASHGRWHRSRNGDHRREREGTQRHRQQATRAVICLLLCALVAGTAASVARADGDPASDYLVSQPVFLSYDAKIPPPQQRKLVAAVASANKQGFPIKVALIWSSYDLGSLAGLFGQPRGYAKFLDIEDSKCWWGGSCSGGRFKTTTRLLVVMPKGLGFAQWKHNPAAGYRALAGIKVVPTPAGLADAATTGVIKLAAASGVKVSTTGGPGLTDQSSGGTSRVEIIAAVVVAILLGAAALLLVRRRAARSALR